MKSGSLRAMPGAAEGDHGLRHVEIDDDAPADALRCRRRGTGASVAFGRQRAEHAGRAAPARRGIDVADDGDLEIVAREHAAHVGPQIVDGDARRPIRACR